MAAEHRDQVEKLVLCSGKVYYDIMTEAANKDRSRVAVARVEQLYTFPPPELTALLAQYPSIREVTWVQGEPRNMGGGISGTAGTAAIKPGIPLRHVGRPERAVSRGLPAAHAAEQSGLWRKRWGEG